MFNINANKNMRRVLVIGASHGIGLETTKIALACGHHVRAFARSSDKINLSDSKLEKQTGDALSGADVELALAGIDVVIQTLGIAFGPQMIFGPVRLFSEATCILVTAMQRNAIRRLISVTGFGAGDSRESISWPQRIPFRIVFGRAYDDKDLSICDS